jgi:drug/metabolite transporter (DMT)-like permease
VATAIIAPFAIVRPAELAVPDVATMGWVLLMVVVPGGGHLLMNWAHRYSSISLVSTLTLGIPVIGVLGAAIILGEPVAGLQIVGMAIALVGLALIIRRPPRSVEPSGIEPPE